MASVVAQAYVEGVSTRRVEDLVEAMGIAGISKSEVSRLAGELDAKVAEFRERPLDAGPYRYLWIDALTQKVREGGRVVNVSAVVATAVNVEGRREIVGFDIVTTESTAAWTAFLRSLVARGLSGVELVISDAHGGIKAAIAAVLGEASWQRCRTHFMANLATRVPEGELADDRHAGPLDLRATRPRRHLVPARRRRRPAHPGRVLRPRQRRAGRRRRHLGVQPPSPSSTGPRSAPTTRRNASTRRSAGAPTSWASSPTGPP